MHLHVYMPSRSRISTCIMGGWIMNAIASGNIGQPPFLEWMESAPNYQWINYLDFTPVIAEPQSLKLCGDERDIKRSIINNNTTWDRFLQNHMKQHSDIIRRMPIGNAIRSNTID